jgi:Ca-activated chloride channel homolog
MGFSIHMDRQTTSHTFKTGGNNKGAISNRHAVSVLTGKVTDTILNEDLIGATVKVLNGTTLIKGSITDVNGEFRINLAPGIYSLEVSFTGYATKRVDSVKVREGELTVVNVLMEAAEMQEVVKTKEVVAPAGDQIRVLPTRTKKATVATTAGASSVDGHAVRIRGSRANSTNYYIDGVRVWPSDGAFQHDLNPDIRLSKPDTIIPESNREQYGAVVEQPFQDVHLSNISTFSIDVDRAAYANVRRFIQNNQKPPADAVRIEEMINYFDYNYQKPQREHPFEVNTEVGPCPWQPNHKLLLVGLQGVEMDRGQLPASNLVFLVDVSGSMDASNKLPLVIQSLELLTDQLRPEDRVAIVVYAGASGLVLPSTPGSDKIKIKEALQHLKAGGGTAGAEGIKLAYQTARNHFIPRGNNRVILCTDGDFNIGIQSEADLTKLIETERQSGIYLSVLGFGMGNYQDGKMQTLADKGNGNHAYIDQLSEARKVFGQEFGGTLYTIAKDVKLQLHFNADQIAGYRLIGYENRLLATEDFNDDKKDAGELGAGHRVTALYELIPKGQALPALTSTDSMFVAVEAPSKDVTIGKNELMVVQLRYKQPAGEAPSQLMEYRLSASALKNKKNSENFALATAIAEFGLLLRDSKYKGNASYLSAIGRAKITLANDPNGYRAELVKLMTDASLMPN